MTLSAASPAPLVDDERLAARETLYRLGAALVGCPLGETQQALEDGRVREGLGPAWQTLTGEAWPILPASPDWNALQVGYTNTFLNGGRGKPRVPVTANAHEDLLGGQA